MNTLDYFTLRVAEKPKDTYILYSDPKNDIFIENKIIVLSSPTH